MDPINANDFHKFTQKKFVIGQNVMARKAAQAIMETSEGITEDAFQLCSSIWNITEAGDEIEEKTTA
ncbi:MAG: hypothetical protein CMI18_03655 [Opitutaceae bacterium]|nr:hypothetical protein [Opitutaceae bacterium]